MKRKKVLIIGVVITVILLFTVGVTYAFLNYSQTGTSNSQLIVGDIYMHFKETNQLTIENAMPYSVSSYKHNSNMTEEEVNLCVNYLTNIWGPEEDNTAPGETYESFCQGTGTKYGDTFQEMIDYFEEILNQSETFEEMLIYFEENNIIYKTESNDYSYKHNSNISEEEVNLCVNYLTSIWGSENNYYEGGYQSFCQGTGTYYINTFFSGAYTFQEMLDEIPRILLYIEDDREVLTFLEKNNIIKRGFSDLPYFEFTIDGKNTYEKEDIWYEIVLSHGDNHATRTERIRDDLLKFSLVEVVDGEEQELFTNRSYNDLTSKRVWVDTIPKNTTNEVVHTYRLYMWISEETLIGNTSDADYDIDTWNNEVYASIKVNATGDFNEKIVETDASCFTTEVYYTTYTHNSNITDEEVNACVTYLTSILGAEEEGVTVDVGETYESFCRGIGTNRGYTFQQRLVEDWFYEEELTYFAENNIIIAQEGIAITDYDESCGTDVVIPKTINDYNVTKIETKAFDDKQLTSVVIPDSVISIEWSAFSNNQLTSVVIPDSVISIGVDAFQNNQLTSVAIKNGVEEIHDFAFTNNNLTAVTIPDSVTILYCSAFDEIVEITKRDDLVCVQNVT